MSTTSYLAWPLPTVEPPADTPPIPDSDAVLAQLLTDLVEHDATHMPIYAAWHRAAVARGIIEPYLVCVDDAYPMPVLELHGYLPIGGRMKARVRLQLVEAETTALVDTEDLILIGAAA